MLHAPFRRSATLVALILSVSAVPQVARAEELARAELEGVVLAGKGAPAVVVEVLAPVKSLRLSLTREDGQSLERQQGKAGRGARVRLALDGAVGVHTWKGTLAVTPPRGETQELALAFETAVLAAPKFTFDRAKAVDLAAHTVTVSVDRDAATFVLKVTGDDGDPLADETQEFKGKPGDSVTLSWTPARAVAPLRIDVRVTDRFGFFQDLSFFPWSIEIPHEDVRFETGRSDVTAEEEPKLQEALGALAAALKKYGRFASVALFVVGHTDTVGDAGHNQQLSEARAQSLARWFRARMKLPVSYVGLGESAPLVATADETAEPKNRRAQYLLAIEPPHGFGWRRLD